VIGQEVLEALLFSVPIVVAANGDASREHAEAGNSGLWFRVDDEVPAAVERLLDGEIRGPLGEQGRSYASSRFADPDTYLKRVAGAFLG
jgi:glycosyltransferase involved in cell wall biosynthesis